MPRPLRRIKKAKIAFISLVPKGVNKLPVIYKEEDNSFVLNPIVKGGENFKEKGELLVIAYAPEKVDSQGDIASHEVIKEMAYDYMKSGGQIDIRHDGKALGRDKIFIAENFIVQKGDPRFTNFTDYDNKPVDVTGSWGMVLKVEDKNLRGLYNNGDWAGVSIGGSAEFEKSAGVNNAEQILQDLISKIGTEEPATIPQEDIFMTITKEDLSEIFAGQTKAINEAVAKAIKDSHVPTEAEKREKLVAFAEELGIEIPDTKTVSKKPIKKAAKDEVDHLTEAPVFKGDPTDANAIAEHVFQVKQFELRKDLDWTDADAVERYQEALSELQKEDEEATGTKRKPAKSKAPKGTVEKTSTPGYFGDDLSKKEQEGLECGELVAAIFKEENGETH